MKIYLDGESASFMDLRAVGAHRYWEDDRSRIILAYFATQSMDPIRWTPAMGSWALADLVRGETVVAHGEFERLWLARYGVDPLSYTYNDTMARALACGLPAKLGTLAKVLWPNHPKRWKDGDGHRLSLQMCKPRARKGTKFTWWDHDDPEKLQRLGDYCYRDVELLRWLDEALPELHEIGPLEPEIYEMNWQMNQKGIMLDRPSLDAAAQLLDQAEYALLREFADVTKGAVTGPRAAVAFAEWLRSYGGVDAPDVMESTVRRLLERVDLRPEVRRALEIRGELSRSSTAKIWRMLQSVSPVDSRARGNSQYYGAHTGRPTGRGIQVRNMPRGKPDPEFWSRLHGKDPELVKTAHQSVRDNLRGMLIAPPGKIFVGVDLSAIEALDLAFYAGDTWVLDEFHATGMLYEPMAVRWAGGGDIGSVTPDQRNAAKIGVLAC
ncbi:MAG: hypothetical protein Q8R28_19030, partial [Dehalococcoidia bacterium]|nr:hypothetical protein [Dehalococcoidia bacterium]